MCILIACQPGKTPTREALVESCCNNPDGFGFAIIAGRRIIKQRGMDATTIINRFLEKRALHPEGHALFHARIGTHGLLDKHNCHPFRVDGDEQILLAHNGILPNDVMKDEPAASRRSDTRTFAEEFFPTRGFKRLQADGTERIVMGIEGLDDPLMVKAWEDWMGAYNKVAILSVSDALEKPLYILNEKQGDWEDGVWYSNDSWLTWYSHRPIQTNWTPGVGRYTSSEWTDGQWIATNESTIGSHEDCPACGVPANDISYRSMVCDLCDACLVCGVRSIICLCSGNATEEAWTNAREEAVEETLEQVSEVGYFASDEITELRQRMQEAYTDGMTPEDLLDALRASSWGG